MRATAAVKQCRGRFVLTRSIGMPAASQEDGASSRQEGLARVLTLLREALQIVDLLGEYPEHGAKLNEVIESFEEELGDQ